MDHTSLGTNTLAALQHASDILYGYDIQDAESEDFLVSLIVGGHVPADELKQGTHLALLRGKEEWDMMFACASAIRKHTLGGDRQDPGLVPYIAHVLSGRPVRAGYAGSGGKDDKRKRQSKKSAPTRGTSRFWQGGDTPDRKSRRLRNGTPPVDSEPGRSKRSRIQGRNITRREHTGSPSIPLSGHDPGSLLGTAIEDLADFQVTQDTSPSSPPSTLLAHCHSPVLKRSRSFKSPFFSPSPTTKKPRPPRGTISRLPFPPLSAPRFGLVQESLSRDPFRLLVAVTFLIRTTGKAAIPVFHRVMERFPTPESFVAADLQKDLAPLITHLGLPAVRCAAIGKYARIWTERPPEDGVRYVVRGYPRLGTCGMDGDVVQDDDDSEEKRAATGGATETTEATGGDDHCGAEPALLTPETPDLRKRTKTKLNSSEWEIGHLTQGRYAIDSWRIFCRDIFLGNSDNWMGPSGGIGKTEEGTSFEPEWMRVLPEDKELRACLRWMWMREGFEWDPLTGKKDPLRDEMRAAVEEGRVKYDGTGGLVILDERCNADGGD